MSGKTKIEWADRVWNPTVGCTPVSEGCRNCYAKRMFERFYQSHKFEDVTCHPERLSVPEKWVKPQRIFVDSMSDLFHESVPDEFIADVWQRMVDSPRHTFMVLTKRPERMQKWADKAISGRMGNVFPNIWLGVSVEDQKTADERIPWLCKTTAAMRFLSIEPMIGAVDLYKYLEPSVLPKYMWTKVWVICGGESGPGARPMHPDWARSLRDQCQAAGVPFFFKQWGEWKPSSEMTEEEIHGLSKSIAKHLWPDNRGGVRCMSFKVGKKKAGKQLDGQVWNQVPGESLLDHCVGSQDSQRACSGGE